MTKFQERIIERARDAISGKPHPDEFNHASLICYKGRILTIGLNSQIKTHTKSKNKVYPFVHSELATILKFKRETRIDLSNTELYNVRIGKSGRLLLAAPCHFCSILICASAFKNVYFTNNLGLFEKFVFK